MRWFNCESILGVSKDNLQERISKSLQSGMNSQTKTETNTLNITLGISMRMGLESIAAIRMSSTGIAVPRMTTSPRLRTVLVTCMPMALEWIETTRKQSSGVGCR